MTINGAKGLHRNEAEIKLCHRNEAEIKLCHQNEAEIKLCQPSGVSITTEIFMAKANFVLMKFC